MYEVANGVVTPVTGDDDDDFVNTNKISGVEIENADFTLKPFPKNGFE